MIVVSSSWKFFANIRFPPEAVLPDDSFYQFLGVCGSTVLHFRILEHFWWPFDISLYSSIFFKLYSFFSNRKLNPIKNINHTNNKHTKTLSDWHKMACPRKCFNWKLRYFLKGSKVRKMRKETLSSQIGQGQELDYVCISPDLNEFCVHFSILSAFECPTLHEFWQNFLPLYHNHVD